MFEPLIDADEMKDTFNLLCEILMKGEELRRPLNFFKSGEDPEIFWHDKERIWVTLGYYENRYCIVCGTDNPKVNFKSLEIICTFNAPFEGVNRRCAGVFLRGAGDKVYLGHSGFFPNFHKSVAEKELLGWMPVQWPDGKKSKIIVVGPIEEETLVTDMAKFVHEVKKYKANHRHRPSKR